MIIKGFNAYVDKQGYLLGVTMKFFFICCWMIGLCGCAILQSENEKAQKIHLGDRLESVLMQLGDPHDVFPWGKEKRYAWRDVVVIIEDDKVVNIASINSNRRYRIQAESYFGSEPQKRRALIAPSVRGMSKNDLEFIFVKSIVSKILLKNGYELVNDGKNIDVVVYVDFGVSGPQKETNIWSEPIYKFYTPSVINVSTTNQVYDKRNWLVSQTSTSNSSSATPTLQYSGERIHSEIKTSYIRHLVIQALEFNSTKKFDDLSRFWKVIAISEGPSNNLRDIIPYLGVISGQLIGTDSKGWQSGYIYEEDPRAVALAGN